MNLRNYDSYISYYQKTGRDSVGYVLNLSSTQEKPIEEFYQGIIANSTNWKEGYKLSGDYSFATNNCNTTVVDVLKSTLPWYDDAWLESVSPYQLQIHLELMPWLIDTKVNYPAIRK